jgi:RNA polymerase sigma-70 factor (ECF subfamily)
VVTSDQALVERLVAGDDQALEELFDRYASFMSGIARKVIGDRVHAEDVVQEVIASVWAHPERYDAGRGSLRAYLGVQAHRRAVDVVRSETRRRLREERWEGSGQAAAWLPGESEGLGAGELRKMLDDAIARLPPEQRRAVQLAFFEGRTQREVAQVLGIPEGTAKSRLRLAQHKLAEWLAPVAALR